VASLFLRAIIKLDILWLENESNKEIESLLDSDAIMAEIAEDLRTALSQLEEIKVDRVLR
jgi:hypothetical protein